MTLIRLLLLRKPAIHFHKAGLLLLLHVRIIENENAFLILLMNKLHDFSAVPKSTRWCSSSSSSGAGNPSSSGNLEAAAAAKEQRDVAEEESDNK